MRIFWNLNVIRAHKCIIQIKIQVSEFKFDNLALDNISSLTMKLITSTIISVPYITERYALRVFQPINQSVKSHADECWTSSYFITNPIQSIFEQTTACSYPFFSSRKQQMPRWQCREEQEMSTLVLISCSDPKMPKLSPMASQNGLFGQYPGNGKRFDLETMLYPWMW